MEPSGIEQQRAADQSDLGGNQYVAIGADNGMIVTSPDGLNWTQQNSTTTKRPLDILWSGSQYVMAAYDGTIVTSPDGFNWTNRPTPSVDEFFAMTWNGNQFLAVGTNAKVLTSPDGITWNQTQYGASGEHLNDVIWNGSQYVAVGWNIIMSSQDGFTWNVQQSTGYHLNKVVWNGTYYTAAGDNGVIVTSLNGVNWTQQNSNSTDDFLGIILNEDTGVPTVLSEYGTFTGPSQVVPPHQLILQLGSNAGQTMTLDMPDLDLTVLGIKQASVKTATLAETALGYFDQAIHKVSAERAKLGAYQNRLEHAMNNASNAEVN
ncbi:flagellin [Paenibacillus apii]|nr:flagellin [Paenibacillus apii]NJJ40649.1 hypothetical protein [Paenibacillus apii]